MPKQLLFYESAVPVSPARHADASVETGAGYAFSAGANAVPLMAVEFIRAATEYAIVFTAVGDDVVPAVVLGVKGEQNLYLDANSTWQAKYVPAFIRRYPFVFSTSEDRKTLTLCIDETHKAVNHAGRGERLFDDERKPSAYTLQVLKFLQDFQAHFQRTQLFCRHLKELGVLAPMAAQVTTPSRATVSLGGFLAVDRKRLREVPGEKLAALAKTDELELLYLHLYSLRNFSGVKDRLVESLGSEALPTSATDSAPGEALVH